METNRSISVDRVPEKNETDEERDEFERMMQWSGNGFRIHFRKKGIVAIAGSLLGILSIFAGLCVGIVGLNTRLQMVREFFKMKVF